MQTLEEITADGSHTLATMLKAAYEAGYAKGRDDVRKELDAFLFKPSMSARVTREIVPTVVSAAVAIASDERATPGTVKPGVLRAIRNAEAGLTTEEIVSLTGFKHNSVRGTIWTLQGEGLIERREHRWIALGKFKLDSGEMVTRESSGESVSNPA